MVEYNAKRPLKRQPIHPGEILRDCSMYRMVVCIFLGHIIFYKPVSSDDVR
jgi:hypothetical protein